MNAEEIIKEIEEIKKALINFDIKNAYLKKKLIEERAKWIKSNYDYCDKLQAIAKFEPKNGSYRTITDEQAIAEATKQIEEELDNHETIKKTSKDTGRTTA